MKKIDEDMIRYLYTREKTREIKQTMNQLHNHMLTGGERKGIIKRMFELLNLNTEGILEK